MGNAKSYVLVTAGKFEFTTRDPEVILQISKRTKDFVQSDFVAIFMGRFGRNVLTSDGEIWARQRRVVASTITEKISRTIFEEGVRQTEGLLEEVEENGGETVKMFDMMKKITINVLSGAGMGAKVNWKEDEKEERKEGYRLTYIEAVKVVIDAIAGPIVLPKWFLDSYPRGMPGAEFFRKLGVAVEEFPRHTRDLVDRERETMKIMGGEGRNNIIGQLLKAAEAGGEEKDSGGKKGVLTDEEVMGNLFIFTAAGFDTSANTLAYALVLLARYPRWQEWIFEEVDSILPATESSFDYTTVFPKATRILAVMFETLRLFPPLIHGAKMTKTPQTITTSTATYHLPANTTVYYNIVAAHLEPEVYRNVNLHPNEEPSETDEETFRPSRWIVPSPSQPSTTFWKPPPGNYVPWSTGARVCPGQKMSQVEFTAIFLKLFQKNRLEAVPVGKESREEVEKRLEGKLASTVPVLTLQMSDVYSVSEEDYERKGKGLKFRLRKRR